MPFFLCSRVVLLLLFLLLLSFECVLSAPNLFSSVRPQTHFALLDKMGQPPFGDGIGAVSVGDGSTSAGPFLTMNSGDGKTLAKRSGRMVDTLATLLGKRSEFGPNDTFRVRLRSLDQMGNTNCYFSPVQCYFFEERK